MGLYLYNVSISSTQLYIMLVIKQQNLPSILLQHYSILPKLQVHSEKTREFKNVN